MNGKSWKPDDTDKRILALLRENARTPIAEIARSISMAPSAVHERLKKLEARGVILGYETRINPKALDLGLTCFTFVRTEETVGSVEAGQFFAELPQVQEVHHTAGHDCYLLKVRVEDTEALGAVLQTIGRHPHVRDSRTTIVLTTLKETLSVPFDLPEQEPNAKGAEAP